MQQPPRAGSPAARAFLLASPLLFFPCAIQAGSVQLFEHSASSIASSGANQAEARDASAIFWNPAALTRLPDSNLSSALHLIEPTGKLRDVSGQTTLGATPITGSNGGSAGVLSPAASFFYSKALTADTTMGVAVTAPFGNALDYEAGWIGRYHALESALLTLDAGLSVGYQATPNLSVGLGFDLQYAKTTLGNALDLSTTCLAVSTLVAGLNAECVANGFATPGNAAVDGRVVLKQDSWAPGWNAGLMWHPSADFRVGLAYRSKVHHDLKGSANFTKPTTLPTAVSTLPGLSNGTVRTTLTFPESVALSAFYQASKTWAVMGAATWVRWSRVQELRTRFDNGADDSVIALEWENTWRVSAAVSYKATPTLTLRSGVAFDQSPTTSAARQTLLIPDADRWVFGIGGSIALSKTASMDFGASRYFFKNLPIEQNGLLQGRFSGRYPNAGINVISIQGNYRF